MHDLDRTLGEFEAEFDTLETGEYEYGYGGEGEAVFDEVEEMELAAGLLEVSNDQELEEFLGKLIRSAGKAVGGFVRSPAGKALGGVLKSVAKTALPLAGTALGNLVVPGVGGVIGGQLASAAGSMFGLELEGMSPQDQEFEVARRFVRLAGEAVKNVAQTPAAANPVNAAKDAVLAAAEKHAPGIAAGASALPSSNGAGRTGAFRGRRASGRWVRRGNRIILLGVA